MRMKLLALLIPAALMLVALVPRVVYAGDISVRVLPTVIADGETCGATYTGRCEGPGTIWCDDWYVPVTIPHGDAVATQSCGGYFGDVFTWGTSGYGVAQSFEPIGPGGPITVASWIEWDHWGPAAIEFRVHPLGIYEFLDSWFAGDADFNSSGATNVQDIFDFLAAWSGSP